ncbi:hypothetical protein ACODT3_38585 [Streptomyces sp. 4.24]|uniref:hypothetical protein n=1 Tax=Streptomyces tritrimontium TaxID=3406573 RepID=UPI003BB808E6
MAHAESDAPAPPGIRAGPSPLPPLESTETVLSLPMDAVRPGDAVEVFLFSGGDWVERADWSVLSAAFARSLVTEEFGRAAVGGTARVRCDVAPGLYPVRVPGRKDSEGRPLAGVLKVAARTDPAPCADPSSPSPPPSASSAGAGPDLRVYGAGGVALAGAAAGTVWWLRRRAITGPVHSTRKEDALCVVRACVERWRPRPPPSC